MSHAIVLLSVSSLQAVQQLDSFNKSFQINIFPWRSRFKTRDKNDGEVKNKIVLLGNVLDLQWLMSERFDTLQYSAALLSDLAQDNRTTGCPFISVPFMSLGSCGCMWCSKQTDQLVPPCPTLTSWDTQIKWNDLQRSGVVSSRKVFFLSCSSSCFFSSGLGTEVPQHSQTCPYLPVKTQPELA